MLDHSCMPNETTTVTTETKPPVNATALETLALEAADDVQLALKFIREWKLGNKPAALALLPQITKEVQEDLAALNAALPEIKAGYKSTEFWLTVAAITAVVVSANLGHPLDITSASLIGALTSVYAVVRGIIKK